MIRPVEILSALFVACVTCTACAEESAEELIRAAQAAADQRNDARAVELLDDATRINPDSASAYYWRGRSQFRLGKFDDSLADFDRYVKLQPEFASRQWERGITCYYAGKFAEGARQFQLYQTYHDNDVENSVWRFLCSARLQGPNAVEKARAEILPIENDRRVPMMQVYAMYQGDLTPDEVLSAARAGDPSAGQLNTRMFYACLYIGLYHEVVGDATLARKFILQAADDHRIGHYMWDVARIHAERLRGTP